MPHNPTTASIMRKWAEQGRFIRWLGGNCRNNCITNLQEVSPMDAMDHIDDWKVDWDIYLTPKEIALVRTKSWRRDGLSFTPK